MIDISFHQVNARVKRPNGIDISRCFMYDGDLQYPITLGEMTVSLIRGDVVLLKQNGDVCIVRDFYDLFEIA